MDNVFIERLHRSLKHEGMHLQGYADGREARRGIAAWFAFSNTGARTSGARQQDADGGLARRRDRSVRQHGCGMTLRLDNAGALPHVHSRTTTAAMRSLIW
jgi:hypothetical protein